MSKMPVRGTTRWQHAITQKKIINHDSGDGRHIMCAWDTCERDAFETYKVRVKTHADGRGGADIRYMNYTFCSERHKQYWLANIRPGSNNCLPPGFKLSILLDS
jgi:hypothetical protein